MDKQKLSSIWRYYLMLEKDFDNTSRYVEPRGQENTYSFEFAKLLILVCTEIESIFKAICCEINMDNSCRNIIQYKETITSKFSQISEAQAKVNCLDCVIIPFEEWKDKDVYSPYWWKAYNDVKHNRESNFSAATYWNAVSALSALYILIFYLADLLKMDFNDNESSYISSEYASFNIRWNSGTKLPGC